MDYLAKCHNQHRQGDNVLFFAADSVLSFAPEDIVPCPETHKLGVQCERCRNTGRINPTHNWIPNDDEARDMDKRIYDSMVEAAIPDSKINKAGLYGEKEMILDATGAIPKRGRKAAVLAAIVGEDE